MQRIRDGVLQDVLFLVLPVGVDFEINANAGISRGQAIALRGSVAQQHHYHCTWGGCNDPIPLRNPLTISLAKKRKED